MLALGRGNTPTAFLRKRALQGRQDGIMDRFPARPTASPPLQYPPGGKPGPTKGYAAVRRKTRLFAAVFVVLTFTLGGIGGWHAYSTYTTVGREEHLRAEALVSRAAYRLAGALGEHFSNLRFLARSLLTTEANPNRLPRRTKIALQRFLDTHHDILNVNIINARETRIVWSAHPQIARPIVHANGFVPLLGEPREEIADPVFARRFDTVIVPMRYRVETRSGRVRLYIGDPIALNNLAALIPKSGLDMRLAARDGRPFVEWRHGQLLIPPKPLRHVAGKSRAAISGYPWTVTAEWSRSMLLRLWWRRVRPWLPLFILLLLGSQYLAALVVKLLSREMQLRLWHETLYHLNQTALKDQPLETLFADAASRIQANLLAEYVFVGARSERSAVGPASANFTSDVSHLAFTVAVEHEWRRVPVDDAKRPLTLALGNTGVIIVVRPSGSVRTVPWEGLVHELGNQLMSVINERRQQLDILRLQRYQVAVGKMQLELIRAPQPDDVYALLVRILQTQTDALGAFVATPQADGQRLCVRVAAAQSDEVARALERLTLSYDPREYPLGQTPAAHAFRNGTPYGPIDPENDLNLWQSLSSEPALSSVRAVAAYPILEEDRATPAAVLVVKGTDPHYFTPALQALLEHLVASVRVALSRYRASRQIDRYRAFYEAIARASQLMVRQHEPLQLFRHVCDVLADSTGVPLTFISLVEGDSARVVASGGPAKAFMDQAPVSLNPCDDGLGAMHAQAMSAQGARLFEKQAYWLGNDAWRLKARTLGLQSALTVSWKNSGGASGLLGIVAAETEFFDQDLVQLIETLGRDISLAVSDYGRQQELLQLSLYDPLTGLANRAYFERSATEAMARASRSGHSMALGILDLDGFKEWNDLQGHGAGDDLLKSVARRLREIIRKDEGVARLGGDEFGLLVTIEDANTLSAVSARLLQTVSEADCEKHVTASIGWAAYTAESSYAALLAHADEALYAAKARGRNTFCLFDGDIAKRLERRLQIHQRLPEALAAKQIHFLLQPQVSCLSGGIEGVELLARWHTSETTLSTADFITDVEKDPGLIRALGRYALSEAIGIRARLRAAGHSPRVAFNVGAHHFLHPAFLTDTAARLEGASGEGLCIEVTENVALSDIRRAAQVIVQLKNMGFTVALDDFGTGYSSLNEAVHLPVDELKLDQRFIRSFRQDPNAFAVANAALLLGTLSGRRLIAEGIEEPDDLALWRHIGGDHVQGHLLSPPLSESDFYTWLSTFRPTWPPAGAVFPTKDLVLVGYAFLEPENYASSDISSLRAGHARLRNWIETRRPLYGKLDAWGLLETVLREGDVGNEPAFRDYWARQLRPAIQAVFHEIDRLLRSQRQ